MKKLFALLLALSLLISLASCGKAENKNTTGEVTETVETADDATIRLLAMTGPTGMGLAKLLHDNKEDGENARYEAQLVSSPDQVVGPIANGTCDIAAVPINLASTLYQRTGGGVTILCANTLGVLYMVQDGIWITHMKDLVGKTIYAPNPGSTPEYVLRYVLKENGIDPDKDVTLEFLTGGDEVAAKLASTPGAVGMLPEPKLSAFLSQNPSFNVCFNMTEEWDKVSGEGNTLIQGVFVARKDFVKEHPALVEKFLTDYKESQKAVNEDKDKGAEWIVEAGIIPKAPLAKKAIPGCNITYLDGKEMKNGVQKCLKVLFDYNPKSVGGALPADDIYYEK